MAIPEQTVLQALLRGRGTQWSIGTALGYLGIGHPLSAWNYELGLIVGSGFVREEAANRV